MPATVAAGWYAGALASSVRRPLGVDANAQLVTYAGHALARRALSWEVGAEYVMLTGASEYDCPEFYVGLVSERLSGRLYCTARSRCPNDCACWVTRGGCALARNPTPRRRTPRFDVLIGLGIALEPFDLRIAWVTVGGREPDQYGPHGTDRDGWTLACRVPGDASRRVAAVLASAPR
ncbi:hypothetical protein ACFPOA_01650 [Lysobacter niabensis]|uniref:hypothetical protein n=1 Tax=Agrilutibacter niabensis TaxID=380628 RepID=UPI00360BDC18